MRKTIIFLCIIGFLFAPTGTGHAKESYSDLFISIGDAIIKVKAEDWEAVETLVSQFAADWGSVDKSESKEAENVDMALEQVRRDIGDKEKTLQHLSQVSIALVAFEKEKNPVDHAAQRNEVEKALVPVMVEIQDALHKKDISEIEAGYKKFLSAWNRKESIVRAQSIPYYGKIETQMGFLRISLSQEQPDFENINTIVNELSSAVNGFLAGKELKVEDKGYTLQTLVNLLERTRIAIDAKDSKKAVEVLQEFLTVWPTVEGEVRTRDGSLYRNLENDIPLLAGKLSSSRADIDSISEKIEQYERSIALLQSKTSYTMWDAALIMLREGLEALLIVGALIAFLRKAGVPHYQKWIWVGAAAGILVSVLAAIIINTIFQSATAGVNREVLEGFTGLFAVVMMVGVGMWLHQKSNMKVWNNYVQKSIGKAISTGSIVSMAFVSFLSIFREGAETIIFYMGMAPSISRGNLLSGILLAIGILALFTIIMIRYSTKIPLRPFFLVATILIYFLAFKILGASIHALQITNVISSTQINQLPISSLLGFYPTWESLIPQGILLIIFIIASLKFK